MVARMPYFSYISMLHLYETLGWWCAAAAASQPHAAILRRRHSTSELPGRDMLTVVPGCSGRI